MKSFALALPLFVIASMFEKWTIKTLAQYIFLALNFIQVCF